MKDQDEDGPYDHDEADDDGDGDKVLEKEKQFPELEFRSHYNSFLPHLWIIVW